MFMERGGRRDTETARLRLLRLRPQLTSAALLIADAITTHGALVS
jgi:hypothetical protein